MTRIELIERILSFISFMSEDELRQFAHDVRSEELQLASTSALQRELELLQQRYEDKAND